MKQNQQSTRVLVVDDSKDICFLLSHHLKFRGFSVENAQSGLDAWKLLLKEPFDIVISDIIMPGMKGTELLQKIKRQFPMIHVIMITGYVSLEHLLTSMRLGAETCIFKPMDNFSELDMAIDSALSTRKKWEEKIVALKGLKEHSSQGLEYQNDEQEAVITLEAV